MLLESYQLEIFNSKCMPGSFGVHCFANLDQDISEAIPYLNASLGGFTFTKEPVSVTFKIQGKLLAVHPQKIAINALKDEAEAFKIVEWLKREINDAWEKRESITPSYEAMPQPKMMEILKLLPKTNCKECGEPTCMVFATRIIEGAKGHENCPQLDSSNRERLKSYLGMFNLDF
ncbi:MAG: Fe-S cluster protein [Desulfamplus sp.]|nr:Fe-S cluster protein [Desulfamplus sp.]